MVDAERLRRVLQRVSDDVGSLRGYASDPDTARRDESKLGHVKYLFVTALEGCVDAAQHVCSAEGWGPPDTNADAMRVLERHGVLDAELAAAMERAVRFRNVLVHGYARVDDARVVETLQRLDDLDDYVNALARLAL